MLADSHSTPAPSNGSAHRSECTPEGPQDVTLVVTQAFEGPQDVTLVVTQAFGPGGHNLVGFSDVRFSGHPAITVLVRTPEGREGLVHLSPIRGDPRKQGFTDIAPGTRCALFCPVTRQPLQRLEGRLSDKHHALYLTPQCIPGHAIALSSVWDDFDSHLVDDEAVISYWAP